jgi:PAS domain S-box-containing protein
MIAQLRDAKEHGETQQRQIENAKAHLESVLTHLSSGVLVVDENFKLRSANASASQILGIGLQNLTEHYLKQIADKHPLFRSFAEVSLNEFADLNRKEWQFQLERSSKNGLQMLLIRGTRLNTPSENSFVIVFDDITHLLQAERQAAWGEVARRLAHEIKNPLTPIQLSAERLQLKLDEKLDAHDARILKRATDTIVSQVAAMKNMVTDFADYARAPAPHFSQLDMHQLIQEIMGLYEGNSSPINLQLDARNFLINGDPTRLRQVLHNLLQNAHDALQHIVMPKIVIATRNLTDHLQVIIRDNGSGFSPQILARVFEPYMTTKSKGTGLGLPIVKKITEEHGGNISIENNPEGGAQITLILPLAKETEVA